MNWRACLSAALLCLSAGWAQAQAQPQRIVSLDLCLDWMLAYYLEPERVAGLSPMQRQQPQSWVGAHWPVHDGSLEQIYQLAPDLVLVGPFSATLQRQRLQEFGLNVKMLPLPNTLEELQDYQQQFLLSVELAPTLAAAPYQTQATTSKSQRLLLLGANGIGTGSQTLEDEILRRAGWDNYLDTPGYQQLDLEQLINDPPDAILWNSSSTQALANQFAEHAALKAVVPSDRWLTTEAWRWQCPGPWMWPLIGQLHQWLD